MCILECGEIDFPSRAQNISVQTDAYLGHLYYLTHPAYIQKIWGLGVKIGMIRRKSSGYLSKLQKELQKFPCWLCLNL